MNQRDYQSVVESIGLAIPSDAGRYLRMRTVCDLLWEAFGQGERAYSWVGFYVFDDTAKEMILAARQPKPACSPISLAGICGQSWQSRSPMVVQDVRSLADGGYIACDPRDLSEVVVPMLLGGVCWGVLDVDSYEVGAFDDRDAAGLLAVAARAGLCDETALEVVRAG